MSTTRPRVALAAWVKTPGFTPAKTRLAASIGTARAEEFHLLCIDTMRLLLRTVERETNGLVRAAWAVAESDMAALAWWADANVVVQGGGTLGERLARVYQELLATHDAVMFIGADAPHVRSATLVDAARTLAGRTTDFLLGPADDGGFHLFGGRTAIPATDWTSVAYSTQTTMRELAINLRRRGTVQLIQPAFDVDTLEDLRRLHTESGEFLIPALRSWLSELFAARGGEERHPQAGTPRRL